MLTAALLQRGMDEETVKKIIGGNWVTYFRRMLPEK
jgi:microsomal dipeptidase-like Zn-dependent dipeptidase